MLSAGCFLPCHRWRGVLFGVMAVKAIRIRNWHKFQHFRDRKPPWIKLYREILDDIEWNRLDPKAAKMLVGLWLLASEECGRLPDAQTIAFRLRTGETETKQLLNKLSHWLEQDDIAEISAGYQDDTLEEEREKEKEKEEDSCPELFASEPSAPDKQDPVVGSFTLVGGDSFQVRESLAAALREAYPGVAVKETISEIAAWCLCNPSKRKTKSGATRFLNSWFAREQNK